MNSSRLLRSRSTYPVQLVNTISTVVLRLDEGYNMVVSVQNDLKPDTTHVTMGLPSLPTSIASPARYQEADGSILVRLQEEAVRLVPIQEQFDSDSEIETPKGDRRNSGRCQSQRRHRRRPKERPHEQGRFQGASQARGNRP